MSLLSSLKEKLNPKGQGQSMIKKLIKSKIPKAKEGMEEFLDKLFLQVAEAENENPFELFLLIRNKGGKLLGNVYNSKKKNLGGTDIGAIAEMVIQDQMNALPSIITDEINKGLADLNISVSELLIQEVGEKRLVAKYNEESELIFIELDGNKKQRIDLEKILHKLDF